MQACAEPEEDLIHLNKVMQGIQNGQLSGVEEPLRKIRDDDLRSIWAANAVSTAIQNDQARLAIGFLNQISDKDLRSIWAGNTAMALLEKEDCQAAKKAVSKIKDFALSAIWKGNLAVSCGQLSKLNLEKEAEDLQNIVENFGEEAEGKIDTVVDSLFSSGEAKAVKQNKLDLYWKGVEPPGNAPPTTLHIDELYPSDVDAESSHPNLINNTNEHLSVKVQKVESDDSLTVRLMPHHETPFCCNHDKLSLAYNAENLEMSACWNLADNAFMQLSEWKERVSSGARKRYTWCLISQDDGVKGWVNSHYLALMQESQDKHALLTDLGFDDEVLSVEPIKVDDPWRAIDLWIVIEHPKRMIVVEKYWEQLNRKAEYYGGLSEFEEMQVFSLAIGGGVEASFKHFYLAIELRDANPDWTAEDLVIELRNQELAHRERVEQGSSILGTNVDPMFGLDFGIDENVVAAIYALGLDEDSFEARRKYIGDYVANCISNLDKIRPSQHPTDTKTYCMDKVINRQM